ncbi:sigma-70 family RNA polymerase sigma factor [Urbifossiella limnaea]|uniref:RNA polymerase sigma factor RpoS n=1 Tax=Urbifossiella limnaea TaxID=2528023 RepID=A0A517XVE9_9BACT|nr:sigma-70 family RNA polymerase sigma factor [Urbifossiella limnaea]QDU21476.1 RNA polymerase sigma factor RpoS [Urbifossiella limnaea]
MTISATRRVSRLDALPGYVRHPSFDAPGADELYAARPALDAAGDFEARYMPDDVTRDHARRMHYAAYRMHTARTAGGRMRWHGVYLALRDRIVLGNRKLVYRAVRRRMSVSNRADDLVGDCHVVLIQAVAAFNPWLDVRFSTYAYTCIVRALSRLSQRLASDWLARAMSLDALPDGDPGGRPSGDQLASSGSLRLDEYLRDDHPLLTEREKRILAHRFSADGHAPTLASVGRAVGLSKERVRQVQAEALDKLRRALS